ncbi:hypothetical protein B0J13DRAFT_590464 [Dactylonectria estremocensis]|uniref:Methyltransferase n=1 Tax=Dactylonectria estremocensis TaxID=1079267 RepID=A0A9P9IDI8_9HYPO|nr:hypothetical protein B0J13DRAFT_590464 [Dactylonectria estremocensis]
MPNDETENNRLDLQHNLFLLTFDNKLGTSTGIWAVDFADEHPDTEVRGSILDVPPNLKFEIDDIDEDWTYSQPFDYIHSRVMNVSVKNWPENLMPEHGTPFIETDRLKHLMPEVGFVDEKRFKELGEWSNTNTDDLLEGLSMALFTRCLGWNPKEVNVFLVDVRKDLNDPKIHAYCRSVYGRKPEA